MKYFLRLALATSIAGCVSIAPHLYAEGLQIPFLQDSPALLLHNNQGYLGVDYRDLDNDRSHSLKVKDTRGAEIVTVDHDAPAGKAGLRVHDVILQMNGQTIENSDQLRRMLRDIPPGVSVNFLVSRDGTPLSMAIQLVDRTALEQEAWPRHYSAPGSPISPAGGKGFFVGGGAPTGFGASGGGSGHGFMGWTLGGSGNFVNVGASVDPLGAQLADYFGVKHGLLIKSVDTGSAADNAGLKAGDVVLKIGQAEMKTPNAWERALRSNQGKSVPVTVLRDHKQQILTLTIQPAAKKQG